MSENGMAKTYCCGRPIQKSLWSPRVAFVFSRYSRWAVTKTKAWPLDNLGDAAPTKTSPVTTSLFSSIALSSCTAGKRLRALLLVSDVTFSKLMPELLATCKSCLYQIDLQSFVLNSIEAHKPKYSSLPDWSSGRKVQWKLGLAEKSVTALFSAT